MILLDTHAAIWIVRGDASLGKKSRTLAEVALERGELAISAISFWEITLLIEKKRLRSVKDASEQRSLILSAGVQEIPLTGDIAILAAELDGLHSDPADRFIAATAVAHHATLVTADERLLQWRHKLRRQNAEE